MRERILITVKTYPTLSKKYAELVCTAGVNENGEWRRIYPIRFRQLNDASKYRKYQWIEADLEKSPNDQRPETYRLLNPEAIDVVGEPLPTKDQWLERREHFLNRVDHHDDLAALIAMAHRNELSLAIFRPAKWVRFVIEETTSEWDPQKLTQLEADRLQGDLFKNAAQAEDDFRVVRKLPHKFSYQIEDGNGKISKMMIEDWEIGALYWNCLERAGGNDEVAVQKVKEKYWD